MAATENRAGKPSRGRLTIGEWLDQQPDVELAPDAKTGELVPTINGQCVLYHANRIAEVAGLPDDWRGNWDALGQWLREDLEIDATTLAAIGRKARWARDEGRKITSLAFFNRDVRGV